MRLAGALCCGVLTLEVVVSGRTLGNVESSLITLEKQVGKQGTTVTRLDKWLFAAVVVGIVAGGFISWTVSTTKGVLLKMYVPQPTALASPVSQSKHP